MSPEIDELAKKIVSLDPEVQDHLLETVAKLNFQKGLHQLSEKYRKRLQREKRLNESAEEILEQLRQSREKIARKNYPIENCY